jgi:hypothetical protein
MPGKLIASGCRAAGCFQAMGPSVNFRGILGPEQKYFSDFRPKPV